METAPQEYTFADKARMLANNTLQSFQEASGPVKALFIGSLAVVGAHLGGAETIYSRVGIHVFDSSNYNELLTGAAVGGTSAAVETVSSLAVSATLANLPGSAELFDGIYEVEKKAAITKGDEAGQSEPEKSLTYKEKLINALLLNSKIGNVAIEAPNSNSTETTETESLVDDQPSQRQHLESLTKRQLKKHAKDVLKHEMKPAQKSYEIDIDSPNRPKVAAKILALRGVKKARQGSKDGALGDVSIALAAGSPGLILTEYSKNPDKKFSENFKTGLKAVGSLSVFNFFLGLGISSAAKYSHDIGEIPKRLMETGYGVTTAHVWGIIPAGDLFSVIKSPLTWLSIFAYTRLTINKDKKYQNELVQLVERSDQESPTLIPEVA